MYGSAWLDGNEFSRGQVQEDDAQHQCEPDRHSAGGHGAASGASGADGQYGSADGNTESTRMDVADRART